MEFLPQQDGVAPVLGISRLSSDWRIPKNGIASTHFAVLVRTDNICGKVLCPTDGHTFHYWWTGLPNSFRCDRPSLKNAGAKTCGKLPDESSDRRRCTRRPIGARGRRDCIRGTRRSARLGDRRAAQALKSNPARGNAPRASDLLYGRRLCPRERQGRRLPCRTGAGRSQCDGGTVDGLCLQQPRALYCRRHLLRRLRKRPRAVARSARSDRHSVVCHEMAGARHACRRCAEDHRGSIRAAALVRAQTGSR